MAYCLQTAQTYSRNIVAYLKGLANNPKRLYPLHFQRFISYLGSRARVLDLGCGPGLLAKAILDNGARREIVGVDLCPEMVQVAKKLAPGGCFICRDIRGIDYPESAFDNIITSSLFYHLKPADLAVVAAKMTWTLKPDGIIFANFLAGMRSGLLRPRFSDQPMWISFYSPEQVLAIMRENNIACLNMFSREKWLETATGRMAAREYCFLGHNLKEPGLFGRLGSVVTPPMIFCQQQRKTEASDKVIWELTGELIRDMPGQAKQD
ncbi:MAG: class I SAM-dependent methyltransferase [Peptococcaceae bacterium]|jgi:SAM-dependent methyltransferase|nr:class I SAM-dependent methyltransferase [Peptococcaceae bacterium]